MYKSYVYLVALSLAAASPADQVPVGVESQDMIGNFIVVKKPLREDLGILVPVQLPDSSQIERLVRRNNKVIENQMMLKAQENQTVPSLGTNFVALNTSPNVELSENSNEDKSLGTSPAEPWGWGGHWGERWGRGWGWGGPWNGRWGGGWGGPWY